MEKKVKWMTQYTKLFVKAMKKLGRKDCKKLENLFRNRYMDYLCSEKFEEYKKYGSIELEKVYAAITHALICLENGISLELASPNRYSTLPGSMLLLRAVCLCTRMFLVLMTVPKRC